MNGDIYSDVYDIWNGKYSRPKNWSIGNLFACHGTKRSTYSCENIEVSF